MSYRTSPRLRPPAPSSFRRRFHPERGSIYNLSNAWRTPFPYLWLGFVALIWLLIWSPWKVSASPPGVYEPDGAGGIIADPPGRGLQFTLAPQFNGVIICLDVDGDTEGCDTLLLGGGDFWFQEHAEVEVTVHKYRGLADVVTRKGWLIVEAFPPKRRSPKDPDFEEDPGGGR